MAKHKYAFTAKRKLALRRAAIISARKRRKHHPDKPAKKKGLSTTQKVVLGGAAVAAVGAGGLAIAKYSNGKSSRDLQKALDKEDLFKKFDSGESASEKAARFEARAKARAEAMDAEESKYNQEVEEQKRLTKAAGNVYKAPQSQEEWDARIKIYGDGEENVIGEFSSIHNGRAEIFPGIPTVELASRMAMEQAFPSHNILNDADADGFITLYHRTAGGTDISGEEAKANLLKTQSFEIRNRDEKRVAAKNPAFSHTTKNKLVWMSNKLNDSNTRAAFGETVVKIRIPKSRLQGADPAKFGTQTFGELSPGEAWAAINPELLQGLKIEDVDPSEIKPPPERKWRAPR